MDRMSRRQLIRRAVLAALMGSGSGCGVLLHPERRGQPAGSLDWKIVALDGVGLLFFFVPGVVAFAVDFATGTIYLPPESYGQGTSKSHRPQLVPLRQKRGELTAGHLEDVVSAHTGQDVRLSPGEYQTRELDHLDDFWLMRDRMEAGVSTPHLTAS